MNRPAALFVSPHLDDVAFSCGGILARLARAGWRTVLATVFTGSVPDPQGFALACQTDKGVATEADYMALRRGEDREAARRLGVDELRWLDFPEAPHRGYGSALALFSGVREGDEIWRKVAGLLGALLRIHTPDVIFAPQALGGHVDHVQVVRALRTLPNACPIIWYRDTPYAIREPAARPSSLLPGALIEAAVNVDGTLDAKLAACAAYATQLGFQFGGEEAMRRALTEFARAEARRRRSATPAAEALLVPGHTTDLACAEQLWTLIPAGGV